jgi:S-DNA-T family DNA segregation ATPase FtsK/SpoIIIE
MNRFSLERQADLIEAVLAAHHVPGRVLGGTVTPRVIRFDLVTTLGVRLQKILALKDELALSLGVPAVRLYREGNALHLEVPRPQPAVIPLLALCRSLPKPPPLTAVLGLDTEGIPLLLRLSSPDVAHVLVAGATGSGKTVLLRSLVLSLALFNPQRKLQLVLIDPKDRGFRTLVRLPHLLRPVVTDSAAAVALLDNLVAEMERRDREGRHEPALVVVIDELADLRQTGGKAVEEHLSRLTQRGREAGMHVVVATQRPTAAVLGGLVKANLPVRLVGAVSSATEAQLATGLAGSGAERLRGRGDFLLVAHGEVIRLQAAYISEAEMAQVVAAMAQKTGNG